MDTKDQSSEYASPEILLPDNTALPAIPELGETFEGSTGIPMPSAGEKKTTTATPRQESLRRFRRDKRAMISVGVIVFFIAVALVGPFIYQHIGGPYVSNIDGQTYGPEVYHTFSHEELDRQNELPSSQYWLGTDDIGRDILARLMQGVLVSLMVAFVVEMVDVILGLTMGVLAGYHGGWIDQFLARFTDLMFAFPGLLFVILLTGIFGSSADEFFGKIPILGPNGNARLLLVSFALAFTIWPLMARYVRGQTLQLKEQQFVEAARTAGTSDLRIILRHITPNLFSIVVVAATLDIAGTIIAEAGISFLGLGVQPPGSSLGLMIYSGSLYVGIYNWEILVPAVVLVILVLAFSFIGDGLRDAFDPRSKD
jgi:oligopeptide transport system permease protein